MSIARRVAKLRAAFGDSLRDAAVRTGVSHTTIARIEKGEVTSSFHHTLRRIADGYGVHIEFLLNNREPRRDFEAFVRRLPLHERQQLYFAPVHNRIRLVLDFLAMEYAGEISLDQVAAALDCPQDLTRVELWPDDRVRAVVETLARITGISSHWFYAGTVSTEREETLPPEMAGAYLQALRKAIDARVSPEVLDMAVDLLITKQQTLTVPASAAV